MSITAAAVTLIIVASIYAGVIFLSRTYNHGGRDSIDPTYSVSQWKPNGWQITSSCRSPSTPGFCVIEGMTGAYQDGTRWCNATSHPCIDPDTGENVKGTAIPFLAVCGNIPFCSWSQCILTFNKNGDAGYVKVATSGQETLIPVDAVDASMFYMRRLAVADGGLRLDQNGTLAQFFFIAEGTKDNNLYILTYDNTATLGPRFPGELTALTINPYNQGQVKFPTIFVLMENMPTTINSSTLNGPVPAVVARKILVFGGPNRTSDPGIDVLVAFNNHSQADLYHAAITYDLTCIFYYSQWKGFYGDPSVDTYKTIVKNWNSLPSYSIVQDAVESRLKNEGGATDRPFYTWLS